MRLIQVYDTKNGQSFNAGFTDKRDMIKFLKKSILVHTELFGSVTIYTDYEGKEFLMRSGVSEHNIELFEFEYIDGRFTNLCKLQVHAVQTVPYIMCDIDAQINEYPDWDDAQILTELQRSNVFFTVYHMLDLKPVLMMICSGILGFRDISFMKRYTEKAITFIREWSIPFVDYECLWTVEELLLTNMAIDEKINVVSLKPDSYIHLQGTRK